MSNMNISPIEAEEALAAIQTMMQKTRHAVATNGTYITLIVTGIVWLIGFMCTQFLSGAVIGYIWAGLSILGGALGTFLGFRMGKRVRSPSAVPMAKRIGLFWLFMVFYCIATIAVARPTDGKQVTMFVILFIMISQLSMGPLLSFTSVWWALPITALALIGYFLLPDIFYLWMAILGGGGMIALGLYIRSRW
ncbi:MAG: hypothetical protein JXB85_13585 [Anaerolineales bacterium]|nr:hypothetical protein [Anaerolineales bacterium]